MAELFASGRIVDAILLLTLLEAVFLLLWRRRTGRGPAPADLGNLAAGGCLLLALRAALAQAAWPLLALALLGALIAHLFDLRQRWR